LIFSFSFLFFLLIIEHFDTDIPAPLTGKNLSVVQLWLKHMQSRAFLEMKMAGRGKKMVEDAPRVREGAENGTIREEVVRIMEEERKRQKEEVRKLQEERKRQRQEMKKLQEEKKKQREEVKILLEERTRKDQQLAELKEEKECLREEMKRMKKENNELQRRDEQRPTRSLQDSSTSVKTSGELPSKRREERSSRPRVPGSGSSKWYLPPHFPLPLMWD